MKTSKRSNINNVPENVPENKDKKVCLVTVDMGYGHQRAAFPLRFLDRKGEMLLANNYSGMAEKDLLIWNQGRRPYEFISRAKHLPVVGDVLFWGMDQLQKIKDFYPRHESSRPSWQLLASMAVIKKKQWGKDLIDKLDKENLPLLTTFFSVAYMAEEFNYRNDIYLVVCDADVSRAWAAEHPERSKIKYLVPTKRVYERLQLYGVAAKNIYYTGFPLPQENTGGEHLDILRYELAARLRNLDPQNFYLSKYKKTVQEQLGDYPVPDKPTHPLTITFAVGGAGAQREMGVALVKSMRHNLGRGEMRINLIAGIHNDVRDYFIKEIDKLKLSDCLNKSIFILHEAKRENYFKEFNVLLRTTDILWTKPSELSFYVALGIPIIITEPLGSQEVFNRKWLIGIGAALDQENIRYANEWLPDWLNSGWLAEAAMAGFFEAPKYGTYNIQKVINGELKEVRKPDTIFQY
ncbi:MAG TPA: hypothetical protein P5267_00540 [Patescibacteria group bacterium]|nr:hypothetical protein [Patescibacteria group bacterium]